MDYLRMRQNYFDPVPDIAEQRKTAHWIEESSSFNVMYQTSSVTERIVAKSPPEIIH
jgi:hypothetical protein